MVYLSNKFSVFQLKEKRQPMKIEEDLFQLIHLECVNSQTLLVVISKI